ncbi:MAG: hypothetical protein ABL996_04005 [Micropepsaceae bacterium]
MRTLSSTSRILSAVAVLAAAALVLGGAYFAGYISELQRDLNDPSLRRQAVQQIGSIETALGYDGFLKAYRNYRLTGDAAAPSQLNRKAADANVAIEQLQKIYASDAGATEALREAHAVTETFVQIARIAPQMGPVALRGTAAMDALSTLPQTPQLETAYLSLRSALDRLKQAEQAHQLGGIAAVLSWSQMLILGALASLVTGLLVVAGLLHLGIINPLKLLERSLVSLGDGNVGQRVWGTDRKDEIGELARAGEKLRLSLTETAALKSLAENSQLRITLEGQGTVLFDRLAADVTSAAEALKGATADLAKLQTRDREEIDAALAKLNQASTGADDAAKALRRDGEAAIQSVRTSTGELLGTAKQRAEHLDQIAARFEHSSKQMESVVAVVKVNTAQVVEEFATATGSIKRLAGDTQQIQSAFFSSCDKISSDAAHTTDKVRALATGLTDAIGTVDTRLNEKLNALDQLEQGLTSTLAKLETGSADTIAALSKASSALDERGAANETRLEKTTGEFEDILRLFREDSAPRSGLEESAQLAEATALLREIASRLETPAPASNDLETFSQSMRREMETLRTEIRDMSVRMTEERILASAGAPVFGTSLLPDVSHSTMRSLADVPGEELMTRLQDLAAEMTAAQHRTDQTTSLKAALGAFAEDVKILAPGADRSARLKSLGEALDRHAEEIETHAADVEPSATALRTELHAISSELRTVAARAQSSGTVKDGPALRETAIELGARAESLFTYLANTHHDAPGDDEPPATNMVDDPSADIATLARLIAKLEARAEHMSQSAVAARFDDVSDELSPAEREAKRRNAERKTGGTIHTLFESIERLNNIAAALARANDVERQRKAAH